MHKRFDKPRWMPAIRVYAPDNSFGGWFVGPYMISIPLPFGYSIMLGMFKTNWRLPFFMYVDDYKE